MSRVFLLDKSGSMESVIDDTIGGFNSFVRSQIPLGGTLTLYVFSDRCTCVYRDVPIEKVEPLTKETYVPGGSTAFFDSMGKVLTDYESCEGMLVVLTDGQENSSRKYTKSHIKDLIRLSPKMEVMYIGVDLESAKEIGIRNSVSYSASRTPELFRLVSESVASNVLRQTQSQTPYPGDSTEANDSSNQECTSQTESNFPPS